MRILTDLKPMRQVRRPVVLAAGFFDGVHRGHRAVLRRTLARAGQLDGEAWVQTFDRHPLKLLDPASAPPLLTANRHKLLLLAEQCLDGCLLLPFTRRLSRVEPEAFVARLREGIPALSDVFVGANWRFGRGGRGTPELLARLGAELGFRVTVVKPVTCAGRVVSSTRIRAAIHAGRIAESARLLGRPFSILGTVVRGRAIGRRIGFPTANLDPHNEALPPLGVYAARVRLRTGRAPAALWPAVLSFGTNPTVTRGNRTPVIEVHLLGVRRNLYGRDLEVFFVKRLRREKRFASLAALTAQIARDAQAASRLLARAPRRMCPSPRNP